MSTLDLVVLGAVLGLSTAGAVLLRYEEEVREAWRRRRGDRPPKTGDTKRWMVVCAGLIAIVNVGLGVVDGDVLKIILGTLWLLVFCHYLLKYRRSRSSQGAAPAA